MEMRGINTIPFDVSLAICGGSESFTSGGMKGTVAACKPSLAFRQMESHFPCLFFSFLSFICLFCVALNKVLTQATQVKDHMLFKETS